MIVYETSGAVIWGGGGKETISVERELKKGDKVLANSRWFLVKEAGLQDGGGYKAELQQEQM